MVGTNRRVCFFLAGDSRFPNTPAADPVRTSEKPRTGRWKRRRELVGGCAGLTLRSEVDRARSRTDGCVPRVCFVRFLQPRVPRVYVCERVCAPRPGPEDLEPPVGVLF